MILLIVNLILLGVLLKVAAFLIKTISKRKFNSTTSLTSDKTSPKFTVGFFHPFCNSGGGGERVLWSAVKVLQDA